MTSIPPPQGMTDADYESIEAAVTETVRGRWFLAEFARRTRAADGKLLLDGMARLEHLITAGQTQLPPPAPAGPSIRLLIQRIKDIASQLGGTARGMRDGGVDEQWCQAVEFQARAVSGLMRTGADSPPMSPAAAIAPPAPRDRTAPESEPGRARTAPAIAVERDPRLDILSGLDSLPLAQKIALFS